MTYPRYRISLVVEGVERVIWSYTEPQIRRREVTGDFVRVQFHAPSNAANGWDVVEHIDWTKVSWVSWEDRAEENKQREELAERLRAERDDQ